MVRPILDGFDPRSTSESGGAATRDRRGSRGFAGRDFTMAKVYMHT
jgi:hypothetical protein